MFGGGSVVKWKAGGWGTRDEYPVGLLQACDVA